MYTFTQNLNSFLPAHEDPLLMEYVSQLHYAAGTVATAKAIATEVMVGYLRLFCKWKSVLLT